MHWQLSIHTPFTKNLHNVEALEVTWEILLAICNGCQEMLGFKRPTWTVQVRIWARRTPTIRGREGTQGNHKTLQVESVLRSPWVVYSEALGKQPPNAHYGTPPLHPRGRGCVRKVTDMAAGWG